jgi:hypothetical protein
MTDTTKRPWYMRKYQLTLRNKEGNEVFVITSSEFEPEAIQIEFRVDRAYQWPNYAEIAIYNLNRRAENEIIEKGYKVTLEAGYKDGVYGVIFDGEVLQPIWDRVHVTDIILRLNCIDSMGLVGANFVSETLPRNQYQKRLITKMAQACRVQQFDVDIDDQIPDKIMPRGRAYFGEPKYFLQDFAQDNQAQLIIQNGKAQVVKMGSSSHYVNSDEALVVNPQNGLVGYPTQHQDAVLFRSLLNPNFALSFPPMLVFLDQSIIRQEAIRIYGHDSRLEEDGLYRVGRVIHIGNTRGNEWYSDVMGVSWGAGLHALALDTSIAATSESMKDKTLNGPG